MKKAYYDHKILPFLLMLPQIVLVAMLFLYPTYIAIQESFYMQDAFGLSKFFVGMQNYRHALSDPEYWQSLKATFIFSTSVCGLSLTLGFILAYLVFQVRRGQVFYVVIAILPYAIAPVLAGVLWKFMFDPTIGSLSYFLSTMIGYDWNHLLDSTQAMILVVMTASWKQISYNFVFLYVAILSMPKSIHDVATLDGIRPSNMIFRVVLPLISPTIVFLVVTNIIYVMFDSFPIIHILTEGGPYRSTETLVYKAWFDAFQSQNHGYASAQSVLLMLMAIVLIMMQNKLLSKKVHYV